MFCHFLSACVKYHPGPQGPAWLSPMSHHTVVLLPGAPLSLLSPVADATGSGGMPSVYPGPGWAASGYAAPNAPTPHSMAMLAPWLHPLTAPGWLPWPGLVGLCAAAVGLLLLHGTGCARVGTPRWEAGHWISVGLWVLVLLCWGVQHFLHHHAGSALLLLV